LEHPIISIIAISNETVQIVQEGRNSRTAECQRYFGFKLPGELIEKGFFKFVGLYNYN